MLTVTIVLLFLFFAGCLLGWCIEVVYRRFSPSNKSRKWINPGFLIGPYLPLYGIGLAILFALSMLKEYIDTGNDALDVAIIILLIGVFMTVIELIAGEIFIVKMHVKLWDYSKERFNYKGIICLRFSIYWTVLGAVYFFFIHPQVINAVIWFSKNLLFSFVIGFFYGVFTIDIFYSFKLADKIRKFAAENDMIIRYEELKRHIRQETEQRREKYKFLRAFRNEAALPEMLKIYLEKQRSMQKEHLLNDFIIRKK